MKGKRNLRVGIEKKLEAEFDRERPHYREVEYILKNIEAHLMN